MSTPSLGIIFYFVEGCFCFCFFRTTKVLYFHRGCREKLYVLVIYYYVTNYPKT